MKKKLLILCLYVCLTNLYAQDLKTIYVSNLTEFINAIESDTEIILTVPNLDVTVYDAPSDLQYNYDFDAPNDKKVLFINHPSGGRMMIRNVNNLTIKSNSITKMFTKNTEDDVLQFYDCENIKIENIILVHEPEAISACEGDVLSLINTSNFYGNNLELNGSGRIGLNAFTSPNIYLKYTRFYHNSEFAISLHGCDNTIIENSKVEYNNAYILFNVDEQEIYKENTLVKIIPTTLKLNNVEIHNNNVEKFFSLSEKSSIILENKIIFHTNNAVGDKLTDKKLNDLNNRTIQFLEWYSLSN